MIELIETRNWDALNLFLIIRISIVLVCWLFMILACVIDFWSGTDTAKSLGEPLQSHGFRKTITKVGDYARVMLFCTMADALGMLLPFYLIPFASCLFSIAVMLIEGKSVIENSARKKAHVADVPEVVKEIVKCDKVDDAIDLIKKIQEK